MFVLFSEMNYNVDHDPQCVKSIAWKQATFLGNGNKKIGDREKESGIKIID